MTKIMGGMFAIVVAAVFCLAGWRWMDRIAERRAWQRLVSLGDCAGGRFDPAMIEDLPGPAQRYLRFAISPGTLLRTAVELEMHGQLGLGTKEEPAYRPMQARQLLAPPHGLLWQLDAGPISGSDAALPDASWTRFWMLHLVPVARASGPDHRRSAFGRVIAEAAFWAPASLLPGPHVRWEARGADVARAVVRYGDFEQAVDITVAPDGAPTQVLIQRWSRENPERVYREQAFGGSLSAYRDFEGYRLPTRVEGGNHFGEAAYFPFFRAEVSDVRFPQDCAAP